jgi:hypothetical protein
MKLLFLYKSFKKFIVFLKKYFFLALAFNNSSFAINDDYKNCSLNPINECFLNKKLQAINDQIEQLKSQIVANKVNPIYIFSHINSSLLPTTKIGPTNYIGSGVITLTITNNSLLPIEISCDGYISMKAFSGTSITDISHLVVTRKYININSTSPIPSDNSKAYVLTQNTGIISSLHSTLSNTLWNATLGTEPDEPLDCKINFLTSSSISESMHVFISLPYA